MTNQQEERKMKAQAFRRIALSILCLLVFLCLCVLFVLLYIDQGMKEFRNAGQAPPPIPIVESDVKYYDDPRLNAYEQFLRGEKYAINFISYEDSRSSIHDYWFPYEVAKFTLVDMAGNGQKELIFEVSNTIYIFGYSDDKLVLWYRGASEYLLENGAILELLEYRRPTTSVLGLPKHRNANGNMYEYKEVRIEKGVLSVTTIVRFEKYDSEFNGIFNEFYFDGVHVEKKEWDEKTEKYLSIPPRSEWFIFDRDADKPLILEQALNN